MTFRRIALVVLVLLGVVAVILAVRGFTSDDASTPEPKPSTTESPKGPQRATDYVENGIARRLTQVSGQNTRVTCPSPVSAKVGTSFTCKVRYANKDAVVSIAKVKIDGPDGHYTWDAEPVDKNQVNKNKDSEGG